MSETIGFIGGGNMTRAIAAGLLQSGTPAGQLYIAEPVPQQRAALAGEMPGIHVSADNNEVVARSDCLLLAVKPQLLPQVCKTMQAAVQKQRPLIVSIAAGVRSADIDTWLGGGLGIARVMPNQPALLRQGVSGIYANAEAGAAGLERASDIMAAVGAVVPVGEEADIDTVTAISGSGPAYFFLLSDMLVETATAMGLGEEAARTLALQTALGSAELALAADEPLQELIARVRSPGGTTAAALDSLDNDQVRAIFSRALTAARDRAIELADAAHDNPD